MDSDQFSQGFFSLDAEMQPRLQALSLLLKEEPARRHESAVKAEILDVADLLGRLVELCPVPSLAQVYQTSREFLLTGLGDDKEALRVKSRDLARVGLAVAAQGQELLGDDDHILALEDESYDLLGRAGPEPRED